MNISNFIIGMGQVGNALKSTLKGEIVQTYDTEYGFSDKKSLEGIPPTILHICFPWSEDFIDDAITYINLLTPEYIIIHSTVPVGTTDQISLSVDAPVMHSPIVGQHDNLSKGVDTFEKWIGGNNMKATRYVAKYLNKFMNMKVKSSSEVTELAKLLATYRFGLAIARAQEEKRLCDMVGVEFKEVVTDFIEMYNRGYKKLGMKWAIQPNTFPGKIGGHCVMQNLDLLEKLSTGLIFPKAIRKSNENQPD